MKCPTCGCEKFYIKDKDDEYEIYEFTTAGGTVAFSDGGDQENAPDLANNTETFCNKCTWHGKFDTLKK